MIRMMLVLMGLFLLLPSCAPVISGPVMKTVDQSVSFADLRQNISVMKGKTLVLGGRILNTVPLERETWVEILEHPLDIRQRPLTGDESGGRFLVFFPGFLDPSVYAPGRLVTVAGQVEGKEVRPLGEMEYVYPVIMAVEHHLWQISSLSRSPRLGIGVGGGSGGVGAGVGVGF
ncbi:Slp family lipoprotein [Desulfonatronovibrio hydrogenovorans]|uniref:Slp family lipoprotein n=1 Tax=Desulfonatronovibrio hydrogenovorans TaxID=53245 RepID=UPI00048F0D71|nr:Slp family lipoprotein [Desulfonatronovibrio hydrogenovorans]